MMKNQLIEDEDTLNKHLAGCTIETIQYHSIVYEMPMYIPFEPPFKIPGWEPTEKYIDKEWGWKKFYVPKGKSPKRVGKSAPETTYHIYYFRNLKTGNTAEISLSSQKMRDRNHTPYYPLRVKFSSEHEAVKLKEMIPLLNHLMKFNLRHIEQAAKNENKSDEPSNPKLFQGHPFHLYFMEPSVDIRGPKKSIDYLHECFMHLYMSRYSKHVPYIGNEPGKVKTLHDGRKVKNDNPTIYISDRAKAYKHEFKKSHYVRFEFMFDKDFLGQKKVRTVDDLLPKRNAQKIWDENCFFFALDIPKIKAYLSEKYPKKADHIISTILDRKLGDKGKPYTDWERLVALRNYKIGKKKLFRSVQDFTVSRWLTLHKYISDALSQLSVTKNPKTGFSATPVQVATKSRRHRLSEAEVRKALEELTQEGAAIIWDNIMLKLGITSRSQLSRFKVLIREYKASLLIASCSTH